MFADFFADLKRRRVLRTAAIYAAAAWGVTEASTTVFEKLHFPEWASMLVVIVFLVGFPISVYLAWVFDITSEGIRRTESLGMRGWGAMLVSAIMLIGGTGALFWLLYEPSPQIAIEATQQPEVLPLQADTIAVLPFVNAQGTEDENYFAEGVAETLLTQISSVRNLRVIARDSSFSLRDSSLGARSKAARLGAAFLLEGSVQRAGNNLRIMARLIDGASGEYLWAKTLDGDSADVFDMQDRIADAVVTQLEPISSVVPGAPVWRRITVDPEAYDHYLRGQSGIHNGSPDALEKAIAAFDRAIELDENFALAYAGRANATALREGTVGFGFAGGSGPEPNQDPIRNDWHDYVFPVRTREVGLEVEQLIGPDIQMAVELAPHLAEVQAAYGLLLLRMWHFDEAEVALQSAIEINPNDAFAHQMLGMLYWEINLYDLAVEHLEAALVLDPLSKAIRVDLANALMYTSDREGAIAQFESVRAAALYRTAWIMVRYPLFHAGRFLDLVTLYLGVVAEFHDAEEAEPRWADEMRGVVVWIYTYLGDIEGARRIEEALNERRMERYGVSVLHGRVTWDEQTREELGPIETYKREEYYAGLFRVAWVIHDESFQDAYDHLSEIMARAPEGIPISPMARTVAARYALVLGDCRAAREHFELAGESLAPLDWPYSNIFMDSLFAYVDAIDYAIALRCVGEEEQARELIDGTLEWLDKMEANGWGVSQIPVVRAKVHALRGEKDQALYLLEQYATLPGPVLTGIKNDPAFNSLEDDPRFQAVFATIEEKNRVFIEQIDRAIEESGLDL